MGGTQQGEPRKLSHQGESSIFSTAFKVTEMNAVIDTILTHSVHHSSIGITLKNV